MTPPRALTEVWRIALATLRRYDDARGMTYGAAVAFYAAFAIAPLIVVVTRVMFWVLGDESAQVALIDALSGLIGPREAGTVADLLERASERSNGDGNGSVGPWLALGGTLIGATGVFIELRAALQAMLGEKAVPFSWLRLLQVRLLALGIVLGGGFLLAVALVAQTAVLLAMHKVTSHWPVLLPVVLLVEAVFSFGVIALLFATLLRWLPDHRMPWLHAAVGACFAAMLFMLGRYGIGLYIATTATESALGAAGSFAALLIWFYGSSQIFLLGAALAVEVIPAAPPRAGGSAAARGH
ncbi:YihY/virulence factor BrkB family protein [Methyloversatilis sp.]|uniref:YihY/virulence factor BrkB family protein n=1 Tax=Methyloversatilis sp. TaxID=2569862 RepID=UPI003F7003AD